MIRNPDRRSALQTLRNRLRRLWRPEPGLPGDPYAHRMAPVRRGPKGRGGAAAVAEPEEGTGGFFSTRR